MIEPTNEQYRVSLCDDKYQFIVNDDTGLLVSATRNGEHWAAAMEWGGSKAVMAMLWRIHELEDALAAEKARV